MVSNFSLEHYLEHLASLVNVDCGTCTPAGIATIADQLTPMFESLGFTVTRHQPDDPRAGPCLAITNQPDSQCFDILMLGHMDTVFPEGTVQDWSFSYDEHHAYGPGVTDMKSGILSACYALAAIPKQQRDQLSIMVALNCDEEIGSPYSGPWLKQLALRSEQVLVCEAARVSGDLIRSRKGNARYRIDFEGIASHAGSALADGASAVYELAQWSLMIRDMVDLDSGTTLNVGLIEGGSGVNVVPEAAHAMVDLRFWDDAQAQAIDGKLRAQAEQPFDSKIKVSVTRETFKPAMKPNQKTHELIKLVDTEADNLGISHGWIDAGGGSDGNLTASLGIPTLDGFGPMGAGFHSHREYLLLDSIEPRISLLSAVIRRIAQDKAA